MRKKQIKLGVPNPVTESSIGHYVLKIETNYNEYACILFK